MSPLALLLSLINLHVVTSNKLVAKLPPLSPLANFRWRYYVEGGREWEQGYSPLHSLFPVSWLSVIVAHVISYTHISLFIHWQ